MSTHGGGRAGKPRSGRQLLATDLDGTLIPLGSDTRHAADLRVLEQQLQRAGAMLAFVTGRHFTSVCQAIEEYSLPTPAVAVCNVGTSIYRWSEAAEPAHVEAYATHLRGLIADTPIDAVRAALESVGGLTVQEQEKLSEFKLSYYAPTDELESVVGRIQEIIDRESAPYSIVSSVDPFKGHGLIDVLPKGVTKAYALAWWIEGEGLSTDDVVFAGDSGNDLAALTAGYRAIVVGNADRALAEAVAEAHRQAGWSDRLHLAEASATSGVLEGSVRYGIVASDPG